MINNIFKKTKITCTIGPASEKKDVLLQLIKSGMNIARLNFSHGTHEEHLKKINTIREIEREQKIIIPIMLDTKGPEIRTHNFAGGSASILTNDIIEIYDHEILGDKTKFSTTHVQLFDDLNVGDHIKLDDGNLDLQVIDKRAKDRVLIAKATNHHVIKDKRGINCPNVHLTMPYISEKDKSDLIFGCEQNLDYVAASFVRNVKDIQDIRKILDDNGGKNIKIISKVENTDAVDCLDDIIKASDGIMVARGDLGVEVPPEEVPVLQRKIISKCRTLGKPVITATQMLDSMKTNPNPTRAEVSDVANAIIESTDSVMLSAESASGEYPNEAVMMQAKISNKMENFLDYEKMSQEAFDSSEKNVNDAIANSVANTALLLDAKMIVCFSETGATARRMSKCRPVCPIIEVSNNITTCKNGVLYWGVYPKFVKKVPQFIEEMEVYALHLARIYGIESGSKIIITGGTPVGAGKTNFMKVVLVDDYSGVIDL